MPPAPATLVLWLGMVFIVRRGGEIICEAAAWFCAFGELLNALNATQTPPLQSG